MMASSNKTESPLTPEKPSILDKKRFSETFENGFGKDDRKIGHRRVHENGSVTYKKRPTTELMTAIQLGIAQSIGSVSAKPSRDILYEDFHVVVTVNFPRDGTNLTPAHHCSDFRFRTYAPDVFRYFRQIFKIKPADFLMSLCSDPLRELPNPGASGSIFYVTESDEFIVKTVQHKEAEFLQKLLPGYYMNLNQNPCTLLPKFYGLFCYQCGGKNIRFVVMNNIISSDVILSEKFDLKGSTYKRKASKHEKSKAVPTLKDLDFVEIYPEGLLLEVETYDALVKTLDRDCRVLESFKIMDYSFLIGIYNIDYNEKSQSNYKKSSIGEVPNNIMPPASDINKQPDESKVPKPRIGQYSTPMESIQAGNRNITPGQIPAKNGRGDRLLLYVGIIDILQSYRLAKKLEHAFKSIVQDGDTVSVHHPQFYAYRFKKFFSEVVFKTLRPSAKRKSVAGRKSIVPADVESLPDVLTKRPDLLPKSNNIKAASSYNSVHTSKLYDSQSTLWKENLPSYTTPHLSINSLLTGGTLTPTNTQRTDATVSFTESSPSVSADNLLEDPTSSNTTLNRKLQSLKLIRHDNDDDDDNIFYDECNHHQHHHLNHHHYDDRSDDHHHHQHYDVTPVDHQPSVKVEILNTDGKIMNINEVININEAVNTNKPTNIHQEVNENAATATNDKVNDDNLVTHHHQHQQHHPNIPCVELEDYVTRL